MLRLISAGLGLATLCRLEMRAVATPMAGGTSEPPMRTVTAIERNKLGCKITSYGIDI